MNSQASKYFETQPKLRMAHAIDESDSGTIRNLIAQHVVGANDFGLVPQSERSNERPVSFLTYAVMVDKKASVEALLSDGADVNFQTPGGWSAMAEAASSSDQSLLPILLSKGGNPNLRGTADRPIATWAYMSDRLQNMNLLLDRGADINAKDALDNTLLMTMANLNDYANMLKLMQRGADPLITSGQNKVSVAWTIQESAGNLTPEREQLRQQVIKVLEAKGVHFPVEAPAVYHWDPKQKKFMLPTQH